MFAPCCSPTRGWTVAFFLSDWQLRHTWSGLKTQDTWRGRTAPRTGPKRFPGRYCLSESTLQHISFRSSINLESTLPAIPSTRIPATSMSAPQKPGGGGFNKMFVMLPVMLLARKIDGEDPNVVFWVRLAYGVVQAITLAIAGYTYIQVSTCSNEKMVYVPPPPVVSMQRLLSDSLKAMILSQLSFTSSSAFC